VVKSRIKSAILKLKNVDNSVDNLLITYINTIFCNKNYIKKIANFYTNIQNVDNFIQNVDNSVDN